MSQIRLVINNIETQNIFKQLIQKLLFFKKELQTYSIFDLQYKLVGLSRQDLIKTFDLIILYFQKIQKLTQQTLIDSKISHDLYQGVYDYLQSQSYEDYSLKQKAIFILQIETKIGSCLQAFNTLNASYSQKNIINSSPQSFSHVWEHIEIVSQPTKEKIRQKYKFMKKIYILTTIAILMQAQFQWFIAKKIFFGFSYPRYLIDFNTARLKSFAFFKYPTIKMAKQIWNIPEQGFSKEFIKLTFERISFNQKIYIPFTDDEEFPDIYTPVKNAIKVRILNYRSLNMKGKISKACCDWKFLKEKLYEQKIDTIMIHMHGGGFIALSSRMMQSMTRKWANELKIPVFSIDYRKPPQHPFPAAPNDCLTVYKFILKKISHYMNIEPKNIYLAGDSAGGNLACSLMGKILQQKLQIPKGIYLAYPTIDIRNKFTPSKINALMDPLLWPTMLTMILKQYLGGNISLEQHPLASPILLTQAFIGGDPEDKRFPLRWPKTYISAGKRDTFYDDSLILMQKLKESNIQCYCRVYEEFCHGYLSTVVIMKECYDALEDSVKDLKKLIFGA